MRIIFATGNAGKMREIREIMADMDMEICSMKEAGISLDIEENGTTFEELSLIHILRKLSAVPISFCARQNAC